LIGPAIPAIFNLLKDDHWFVRQAGADALYQLLKQGVSVDRFF
jgi:HEAT repeat protein